jgi:hypothetical protein
LDETGQSRITHDMHGSTNLTVMVDRGVGVDDGLGPDMGELLDNRSCHYLASFPYRAVRIYKTSCVNQVKGLQTPGLDQTGGYMPGKPALPSDRYYKARKPRQ